MQGKLVWSLVWEDPTCLGQLKPVHHNHWVCVLESMSLRLLNQQLMSPCAASTEAHVPRACAPQQEKPPQWEACAPQPESSPCPPQLQKARAQQRRPSTVNNKIIIKKLQALSSYPSCLTGVSASACGAEFHTAGCIHAKAWQTVFWVSCNGNLVQWLQRPLPILLFLCSNFKYLRWHFIFFENFFLG